MKRFGHLWPHITTMSNLLEAARKAQRGKRFRQPVLAFNYQLERNLLQLQSELLTQTYRPGPYRIFHITDPKPRTISAAPYRDRVVHHALCNVIVPLLDRTLIHDTYANRIGYGTHRALRRFVQFARTSQYVLQCDIRKYFASIDRDILKQILRQKIKCPDTLWLADTIVDNGSPTTTSVEYFPGDDLLTPLRPSGLPIGNLTSQFFANLYLNGFDHFVKEKLKVRKYVRYVDDFSLFASDRDFLVDCRQAIEQYLAKLRLAIHPIKSQLFEVNCGATFLGFRVVTSGETFPRNVCIRVKSDSIRRARRRLKKLQSQYACGKASIERVAKSIQSWQAHLAHADTWRLREQLFAHLVFARA